MNRHFILFSFCVTIHERQNNHQRTLFSVYILKCLLFFLINFCILTFTKMPLTWRALTIFVCLFCFILFRFLMLSRRGLFDIFTSTLSHLLIFFLSSSGPRHTCFQRGKLVTTLVTNNNALWYRSVSFDTSVPSYPASRFPRGHL